MVDKIEYILVWGAAVDDCAPLFPGRESTKGASVPQGPPSGKFRQCVRDELNNRFGNRDVQAVFSEGWMMYGHAPENPGFYEPIQLEESMAVVMLLPGPRSLAVNTWELALALESADESQHPFHVDKLIVLLPESVYAYLCDLWSAGIADPKGFDMQAQLGKPEPALGAANSFAARWLCLAIHRRYGGVDVWAKLERALSFAFYKDAESWRIGDSEYDATLAKISQLVERRIRSSV